MTTKLFVAAAALAFVMAPAMSAQTQAPVGEAVPTFSKDVAPILFANCTHCHRPGEIAPMSLLTFKDARPWARSIATQVKTGAMPPWHADPAIGQFVNERRLTEAQKATIDRWADAGAPEGDPKDLPPAPHYAEGWSLGEPDVILSHAGGLPDSRQPARFPIATSRCRPTLPKTGGSSHGRCVRQPRRRASRDRLGAAAGAGEAMQAAAKAQAANSTTPRPPPVIELADGMDIPAAKPVAAPLPENQRRPPDANDRPRPRGTGGRSAASCPGNSRACFLKAPRCGCLRDRRSSFRCTTRRSAKRQPIARASA